MLLRASNSLSNRWYATLLARFRQELQLLAASESFWMHSDGAIFAAALPPV
jgi:hypothetical protein